MNNLKKDQLFDLLTQLDDKYYEEAIGGDPTKPLKIDVSRKPVKWYQIAAPIAACLVIAAGIIAAPRVIDHIRTANSDPDVVISDPDVSISEPEVSIPEPVILPELADYYEHYPLSDLAEIPVFDTLEAAAAGSRPDLTINVMKYGEFEVCLSADGVFRVSDETNWGLLFMKDLSLSLVKDGARYSHAAISKDIYPEESVYNYFYHDDEIPSITIHEFSDCAVASCQKFFSIKDYKISALSGRMADSDQISTMYTAEEPLVQQGNSLIDNLNGREYRFNFDTFGDTSGSAENFTELFRDIEGETIDNVESIYPVFKTSYLHSFDSEPSEMEKAGTMRRGMMNRYTIGEGDPDDPDDDIKIAIVGEYLYKLDGEDDLFVHGENFNVIMYKNNKLLKRVKLAPDYDKTVIGMTYSIQNKHYYFDGYTIVLINQSCFAAVTDDGGLVLLKGLMPDGTLGCAVAEIEEMNPLVQDGNSLFDIGNGVEYRFSPDNFKYTDPTKEQAHFTAIDDTSEFDSQLRNGHVYNNEEENIPMPDLSGYKTVLGSQDDLDRWNSFIASADPPILTFVSYGSSKQMDINKELYITFRTIQTAEFGLLDELPQPPMGLHGRRAPEIFGFDNDGNMLFSLYFNGEDYVQVSFDGTENSYCFSAEGSGISSAGNYM